MNPLFERPRHLFRPSSGHSRLECVPETVEMLSQLTEMPLASASGAPGSNPPQVCVICVVGQQRGGKSTLLNLLHSRQPGGLQSTSNSNDVNNMVGFGLGHTMDAHTTGLWIWAKVHPRRENTILLLCDTEGLDSPHVPTAYNWMLSALALLISTCFVYQTRGAIDSASTDRLGAVLQVAQQLQRSSAQVQASDPQGGADRSSLASGTDVAKAMKPNLLWLVRDHQLMFTAASPKEEMEQKLDQRNLALLRRCFKDYDCSVLPRPVHDDSLLRTVESMQFDQLVPEFKEEYTILERQMLTRLANSPIHVANAAGVGAPITGPILASLCELYSRALNSGQLEELGQLPTQRQMVLQMSGEKSVKLAVAKFKEVMSRSLSEEGALSIAQFDSANTAARDDGLSLFSDIMGVSSATCQELQRYCSGSAPEPQLDQDVADYFNRLQGELAVFSSFPDVTSSGAFVQSRRLTSGALLEFWDRNFDRSSRQCREELDNRWKQVSQRILATFAGSPLEGFSSLSEFDALVEERLVSSLRGHAISSTPAWNQTWTRFQRDILSTSRDQLRDAFLQLQIKDQLSAARAEARADLASLKEELLATLEQSSDRQQESLVGGLQALQQDVSSSVASAKESLQEELQRTEAASQSSISALEGRVKASEDAIQEQSKELAAAGTLFSVTKDSQEQDAQRLNDGLIRLKDLTSAALKDMTAGSAALQAEIATLSTQMKHVFDAMTSQAETTNALQSKLRERDSGAQSLLDQVKDVNEKVAVFESAFAGMDQQFESMSAELKAAIMRETSGVVDGALSRHYASQSSEKESSRDSMRHVKETCDALWTSVGALNGRAADIEARLDAQIAPPAQQQRPGRR